MTFTKNKYEERNFKLSKIIIDYYGVNFFRGKKILDLGCGNGEIANIFSNLGSNVLAVDARQENINIVNKKFPKIKTLKVDLDEYFPFLDQQFDLILSLGLICHLSNYYKHIEDIFQLSSENIIIETEVLDCDDISIIGVDEDRSVSDLSFNGLGSIVSSKNIQDEFVKNNYKFKIINETKINTKYHHYDWLPKNIGRKQTNRRLWFLKKENLHQKIENNMPKINIGKSSVSLSNSHSLDNKEKVKLSYPVKNKKFVMVIPSYKNNRWCQKNILSALNQNYDRFRIIFVDDMSTDNTFDLVSNIVKNHINASKCTLIRNAERVGALENLYNMIHSCSDDEIIITLDGDDWLPNNEILNKLNSYYSNNDIWMTYGQYANSTNGGVGCALLYPDNVIASNSFRSYAWGASHLRTFYTWLFKKIKKQDLIKDGKFFEMTWDLLIMYPQLEMSGYRSKFISECMYIYNMSNEISDHRKNRQLQYDLDLHIRKMPKYSKLKSAPRPPFKKIGLLLIATGKYDTFIPEFIKSADKFFLNDNAYDVTYYIFTDKNINIKSYSSRKSVIIPINHKPFPYASMDRFKHFINNENKLNKEDYLYYCDVDSVFVNDVSEEIIGDTVGVRHCGFTRGNGTFETNTKSSVYVDPNTKATYFGGGFSGGKSDKYLELSKWCKGAIEKDLSNDIMPRFHDESAINRYFADNKPSTILSPSYHYPQSNIQWYKNQWGIENFEPRILLLDKNHKEIRGQ